MALPCTSKRPFSASRQRLDTPAELYEVFRHPVHAKASSILKAKTATYKYQVRKFKANGMQSPESYTQTNN